MPDRSGEGPVATCVAEACSLKVSNKSQQLCEKHYQAYWKYGDPNGSRARARGERCHAPDCERTRSSREGLCSMHRQRLRRTGSLEKRKPKVCSEAHCNGKSTAKGLCQRHYDAARKNLRRSTGRCSTTACSNAVKARGLCRYHYAKLQRTGRLSSAPLAAQTRAKDNDIGAERPTSRPCRGCGKDLAGLPRGLRYCSEACKPRCIGPACDRRVSGKGMCSSHAKQQNRGETLRVIASRTPQTPNGPCGWCGEPVGAGSASRYCSITCRNLARRHPTKSTTAECSQCGKLIDYLAPANGSGNRMTPISKKLCDDCRHRSASLYLSADDVRARDGDYCSICGLPVPTDAFKPHPLAAEVDHIVPIARGGSHDPKNLALAHKTCNIAKGDKFGWRRDPAEVLVLLEQWRDDDIPMTRATCAADECDRVAGTKGMCDKHYRRVKKYGTTQLPARPSTCSAEDCIKPVRARGLCRSHYTQWLRSRSTCKHEGCGKVSHTRELCKRHYSKWLLSRPDQPKCSAESCARTAEVRGLCNLHYSRVRTALRAGAERVGPWD